MASNEVNIVSFPRSGNHLVRTIVEFSTQRPTIAGPTDPPIFKRSPNKKLRLIDINNSSPIGYKSHGAAGVFFSFSQRDVSKILLVVRDPLEAISSHGARSLKKKFKISHEDISRVVSANLEQYISLLYVYKTFPNQNKHLVKFEDLLGANGIDYAQKVGCFCGAPQGFSLTNSQWSEIKYCAKKSQESLKPKYYRIKEMLKNQISERISYQKVLDFVDEAR